MGFFFGEYMNELALFAGAGGGLLGGSQLGWRTRCAVEIDPYARKCLLSRRRDGVLEPFPIWDDIKTFSGYQWRGSIDIITGGFPCQDISSAGRGGGFPVRKADYGSRWRELSVRYDQDSFLWKTHRCLWSEVLEPLSVTFPRWGMILGGVLWERITQEPITSEAGSGYWPTPTAHNAKEGNYPAERTRKTPTLASLVGGKLNPTWVEWLMGWPLGWTDLKPIKMEELLRWKIAFQTDQSVCEQSETDKSLPQ
jgi:DNA (cytosine-5)-methyltransferase 1